ncbi:SpoIVB peptidase [Salipaludibacillus neizhouensis]|uniref:SpoIVB peptidase n=1 Tax=Salipaludibacillus neizhouensis TaxID=885475 RepID=A0A3A9KE10_9BACI|nr:SpoIVB peptidase [Salipaludibacillus neizhouensis]RKL68782.1 SpoIVB peptidase [Salipaludibacillus neizhouensis]
MSYRIIRKTVGILLLAILFSAAFYPPIQNYVQIPDEVAVFEGQSFEVPSSVSVLKMDNDSIETEAASSQLLTGKSASKSELVLGANGIPFRSVDVTVHPELKVIPSGQSIGVRVQTNGVLVVGHHILDTNAGKKSPGEESGIQVGDAILKMDGLNISEIKEIQPLVQKAGENNESILFEIKRDGKTIEKKLKPIKRDDDENYQLGLYIRDSAAGVGTLTFYEPKSKKYGALGHVISDMETKEPIEVSDGEIIYSDVTSIEKGLTGEPGEKLARFSKDSHILGNITNNTDFGIFGKLHGDIRSNQNMEPMEVGLAQQVKEGPAEILTVVDGEEVQRFDIEIVSSTPQKGPATKGMVIKVTDEDLLNKTGGIVQGMSGSPIIQNDRIIGAVTHVFVNDPSSGYGCHIEWMLRDADISLDNKSELNEAS